MANIKLLQLYRNSNLYENLSVAKSALEENAQKADGEILIARYKDSNSNPKALVGIYNGMSGQSATITYLEGVNISESSTVSDAVQAAIDAAIEALVYSDSATEGQFVTSVSETSGVISVTRAGLTSEDGTVVVNGYDLAVNIDGSTITKSDDGVLSVASSALTQYVGENAVAISDPDANNDKTVSLVIDESDKVLSQSTSGLKTTLSVDYTSSDHMVNLRGIDDEIISSFDATEFVVDGMITDVELVHENPETGATGEFIEITWNIEGGETKTIYLDVTELIDIYTAGNGIDITDNVVSVKIADSDEGYLQSTEAGIKTEGIDDAIASAVATETSRAQEAENTLQSAVDAEESRAEAAEAELQAAIEAAQSAATTVVAKDANASHLTVESSVDSSTGATTYTIGESDIASASDLSSLQSEVTADEGTINNIIASAGLNSDGTLTDVTLPGDATTLVDAITALESEIQSDETKLTISSSDKSITVTSSNDGTDVIVTLSAVSDSNYATDMIVKDTDGGLALNPVWDAGEY